MPNWYCGVCFEYRRRSWRNYGGNYHEEKFQWYNPNINIILYKNGKVKNRTSLNFSRIASYSCMLDENQFAYREQFQNSEDSKCCHISVFSRRSKKLKRRIKLKHDHKFEVIVFKFFSLKILKFRHHSWKCFKGSMLVWYVKPSYCNDWRVRLLNHF